ncbi:MAG: hypothetical protein EHM24_26360 [Acidobacteria bacterium]|nr:MAG: hypothetical protein EHM24_26360 [Acidobacteriota bacterium]
MKRLSRFVLIAALVLTVASPAFAAQCPKLWKEANEKMASMDQNSDKVKQAKTLIQESQEAHKAGNHPVSEKKAQEAIDLVKG